MVLLLTGPVLPFTAYIFLHHLSKWNTPCSKTNTHEISVLSFYKSHMTVSHTESKLIYFSILEIRFMDKCYEYMKSWNNRALSLPGKMHQLLKARSFILMVYLKYGLKNLWDNMRPSPGKKIN